MSAEKVKNATVDIDKMLPHLLTCPCSLLPSLPLPVCVPVFPTAFELLQPHRSQNTVVSKMPLVLYFLDPRFYQGFYITLILMSL